MRGRLLFGAIIVLMCTVPGWAGLVIFENWEMAVDNASIHNYNGWIGLNRADSGFWTGTSARIVDMGDGNMAVRWNSPIWQSRGFKKALGNQAIAEGQTGTVYFRFLVEANNTLKHTFALTNDDNPNNMNQEIVGFVFATDGAGFMARGRSGGSVLTLKNGLSLNTWYSVWLVIDQATDTYDVYLTEGSAATEADLIGDNLAFRLAVTDSLDTIYTWAGKMNGTAAQNIYIDDIAIDPGAANLALPIVPASNPSPAQGAMGVGELNPEGTQVAVTFSWDTASDAGVPLASVTKHYLYIATDEPNLALATPIEIEAGSPVNSTASYGPEDLDLDSRYYWRVDESIDGTAANDPNTMPGPVWYFDTLKSVPVISSQPTDELANAGDSVSLSFAYTSASTASFQWYRSTDYSNATPEDDVKVSTNETLDFAAVAVADQGYYYCAVSNEGGTTDTNAVRLGVRQELACWTLDEGRFINGQYADETGLHPADPNNPSQVAGNFVPGVKGEAVTMTDATWARAGSWRPNAYTNQMSVSAWVKLNEDASGDGQGVVSKREDSSFDWALYVRGGDGSHTGANWARFSSWTGGDVWAGPDAVTLDGWSHLVAVVEGSQARIYRNGVLSASGTWNFGANVDAQILLGKGTPTDYLLPGALDEVRIYNYALDAEGVAQLYYDVTGESVCIKPYMSAYDVDHNCKVDLNDFAQLANAWLSCGLVPACE